MPSIAKLPNGLTILQNKFVNEYLTNGLNGAQAVLDAGYNTFRINAPIVANTILKVPAVQKAIEKKVQAIQDSHGINFEWKLKKLKRVIEDTIPDEGWSTKEAFSVGIKALAELNKMQGDYAAEKRTVTNLNIDTDVKEVKEYIDKYKREY